MFFKDLKQKDTFTVVSGFDIASGMKHLVYMKVSKSQAKVVDQVGFGNIRCVGDVQPIGSLATVFQ